MTAFLIIFKTQVSFKLRFQEAQDLLSETKGRKGRLSENVFRMLMIIPGGHLKLKGDRPMECFCLALFHSHSMAGKICKNVFEYPW